MVIINNFNYFHESNFFTMQALDWFPPAIFTMLVTRCFCWFVMICLKH